jgi:hypothetical protein
MDHELLYYFISSDLELPVNITLHVELDVGNIIIQILSAVTHGLFLPACPDQLFLPAAS